MGRASRAFMEFVSGMLAGLALGYVAAVLLAPDEGAESRERLQHGAGSLRETPRNLAGEVQTRVQQAMEQGRQAAESARAELERAAGLPPDELKSDAEGHTPTI